MPLPERIAELFRQVAEEKDSARRVELMRELRMLLAEDRKRMRARTLAGRAMRNDPGRSPDAKPSRKLTSPVKSALEFVRLLWRGFPGSTLLR